MSRCGSTSSGSSREPVLGYPRAVRFGNQVFVAGMTARTAAADLLVEMKADTVPQ